MRRFFSFGCSFTSYMWPTWADIIGHQYPNRYYNFAEQGMGNIYIFSSLVYAIKKHNINKDDLVIICWSAFDREDRYMNNKWIQSYKWRVHDKVELWDERGSYIQSMTLMNSSIDILNLIGCENHFLTLRHVENIKYKDVTNMFPNVLSKVKNSFEHYYAPDHAIHKIRTDEVLRTFGKKDHHPLTSEHYYYVKSELDNCVMIDKDLIQQCDELVKIGSIKDNWQDLNFPIKMLKEHKAYEFVS